MSLPQDGAERYESSRAAGVIDRAIKLPFNPRETDRLAKMAEYWFLQRYGMESQVQGGMDTCDFRYYFKTKKYQVDKYPVQRVAHGNIKWTPRLDGHLVVPKDGGDKHRCLVYVLIVGDPDHPETLRCGGWAWGHRIVTPEHLTDLDGRLPKAGYALPQADLWQNPDILMACTFNSPPLD